MKTILKAILKVYLAIIFVLALVVLTITLIIAGAAVYDHYITVPAAKHRKAVASCDKMKTDISKIGLPFPKPHFDQDDYDDCIVETEAGRTPIWE